jgi:pilus assembly protein FimV
MGRKMGLITRGALSFGLLLAATFVQAAGLGKLTVNSSLGQILNAEIDLVSLQPGELDALNARVSPPEAFRDARIEYSSALRMLRFSVEKRQNGQPYIKISSVAPINEPFVDMLIEVSWPAGRIQREYPILLDPPGYANKAAAPPTVAAAPAASRPAETPPASAPAASSSAPAASTDSSPATTSGGTPSARAELASAPPGAKPEGGGSDTYGPVEKGDTLNKIATQTKPSNVSLEQMLVALYRENQSAFVNNNMNRLKTGQILKVPSAEEVEKIAAKDANQEYRTHVSDWNSYRQTLAGGVASIPARAEPASSSASGKVASAAVTPPAPPAAETKDVLKLSKSEAGKGGAAKGAGASQDRVNAMQEELTAKDKALRESQSRVADLEKQIRDMQRLLDLKAAAPAKPDAKVAAAPPTPAKVEPAKPEPPKVAAAPAKPEPAKVEPAKVEPAKPEPPKVAEAPKPAEPPKAEPPKVAEAPKPAPPKTDAKAPAKKAAPPPQEKGFVDELMDNPWVLMAGVGGLAALGIGGFLFMRRRKAGAEAGPSSSMTSAFPSDLKPSSTTGKAGGGLVDTGNSSFLTDFDKTGPGTIDTDEVDPVAEAEVYIAYGRDAQAEEILKEAMARDKGRHEIPLKLLEIYHARKSATAFETVAKELRNSVGEDSPMWQKAAAMGAQIDPTNPLYAAGQGAAASYAPSSAAAAKPDVDFGIDDSASASQPAPDFDLNVDPTRTKSPESTGSQLASGMDFDIESSNVPARAAEPAKEEKPASFDFDLSGLDFPGSKPADTSNLETTNTPAMADLSLDSGGGSDGVGTKLELAKAYLEIGDKDGAREILQEVAKEGSPSQREEAEKLIASL